MLKFLLSMAVLIYGIFHPWILVVAIILFIAYNAWRFVTTLKEWRGHYKVIAYSALVNLAPATLATYFLLWATFS